MGIIQKIQGDVDTSPFCVANYHVSQENEKMNWKSLSIKPKLLVLAFGSIILLYLIFSGKLIRKQESPQAVKTNEELLVLGTSDTLEGLEKNQVYTNKGIYTIEESLEKEEYLYQCVQALTFEKEILHIQGIASDGIILENCLITENTSETVSIFSEGFFVTLPVNTLSVQFHNEIADLHISNGGITKISTKKEMIQGKILSVREDEIELEGYGLLPCSNMFRFYETHGTYEEKSKEALVVGYEQAQFIVAEGEVCAAVLKAPLVVENIRVLIKTTDHAQLFHPSITIRAQGEYEISYGEKTIPLHDGQEVCLDGESEYLQNTRARIAPKSENARLAVLSIERGYGTPVYAGVLEVTKEAEGLALINELDLETYLYSVVPSEMPANYEIEALKAQAVCARSYAYRQILLNGYAVYGAHVDDSVSYQVYNNLTTNEKVIRAVNETAGEVLKFGDEIAITYYFSTSCGHTTNETIWESGSVENTYLSGKLLNDQGECLDLRKEEVFREFILNESHETYDCGESWYRWELTVPIEQLTDNVNQISDIGKVTDISVIERNEGGVVQKISVEGEHGQVEIPYEFSIRSVLNGKGQTIKRNHAKDVVAGAMLPSGYFVLDRVENQGKLTGFRIRGGGFGHGVGMSQNGANHMAEKGKNYEEILSLFYEGTRLEGFTTDEKIN